LDDLTFATLDNSPYMTPQPWVLLLYPQSNAELVQAAVH